MTEMSISRWSVIAEVVSAVAVVLSLIYVGSEIRQNTIATQLSNQHSAVALGMNSELWLGNSEFAAVYDLGLKDFSALDGPQRLQFDSFVGQKLNIWEFTFYGHERGLIADDAWRAWDGHFKSQIILESWRFVWTTRKRESYQGPFQDYVDAYLADD